MQQLTIGIDVSQEGLDVAYWDGKAPQFIGTFANDTDGLVQFSSVIENLPVCQPEQEVLIIIEPTGGYEQLLSRFAIEHKWNVALPNPRQVRDWARGMGVRAKTDKQDALILAHYGASVQPATWSPPEQEIEILSNLLDRLSDLQTMRQMEANRLHAHQSKPVTSKSTLPSIKKSLQFFDRQIEQIQTAIDQHFDAHPPMKNLADNLLSIPGVGNKNVQFLVATLGRFDSLTDGCGTAKQLTAFVGLDPVPYQSGTSVLKRTAISKAGDPILRRYLFLGALGGKRGDNLLKAFYERLIQRGKHKMVALIACDRKILVWSWAIFRQNTTFNPQKACPAT